MVTFPTEFLFRRLPDFWSYFADREDVKNVWDAYLRKTNALNHQLISADISKSLSSVPLLERNELEYFIFSKFVRRPDLETNAPFYVYEVDPSIFFIKNLNEKIDDTLHNRVLSSPGFFDVLNGAGVEAGRSFLRFARGVAPTKLGETFWTRGSDIVTGAALAAKVLVGDVVQGQNGKFYKVIQVPSDTSLKIQGLTTFGDDLGPGDGAQLVFNLAATELVIPSGAQIFFDGLEVSSALYTVTPAGLVTFITAPPASVVSISANYYLGYDGVTAYNRNTVREGPPTRLFSTAVYRDRRSIYKNFGVAIGLDRPTSKLYLSQVRGIYFARYNGPTLSNMSLGSGILIDIPFAERGRVSNVIATAPKSVIVDGTLIQVPDPLTIAVLAGQELPKDFNLVSDGIKTGDFLNSPYFQLEPLKSDPAKFHTFLVLVKGSYAAYVAVTTGQPVDYDLLKKLVEDIKPTYTKFFVATELDFLQDNLNLFIGPVDVTNAFDAAATLEFNCVNFAVIPEFMTTNGFPSTVADELLAAGPVAAGLFATAYPQIAPGTFEVHAGTIGGTLLADPADYTVDLATGVLTLTAAGAIVINAAIPPDIHVKYTSGLVGEAALSAMCVMDSDSIGIYEEYDLISGEALLLDTLENNLVNFGTFGGPPPVGMDDDSVAFTESLQLNDAIGTPPASFIPPFTPGALVYTTPP
jgi:hypothetical protein